MSGTEYMYITLKPLKVLSDIYQGRTLTLCITFRSLKTIQDYKLSM